MQERGGRLALAREKLTGTALIQKARVIVDVFREQARSYIRLRVGQNSWVNSQYRLPDYTIAAGNVKTQAINKLRMVRICKPPPLATMVPATPDDNT